MIQNYYNENKTKFLREKDAARYIQIVVEDVASAWSVKNQATPDNFLLLASKYSKVPVADPRTTPFVNVGDIPPQIAREDHNGPHKGYFQSGKNRLGIFNRLGAR